MEIVRGTVVFSAAGHDKGGCLIVLAVQGERLLLADGKNRTVGHPKKKNRRHVRPAGAFFELPLNPADADIRRLLRDFRRQNSL